jgi:hypothetical protein
MSTKITPVLFNVKQTAAMLNVSERTIHNLVSRGDLVPTRIGDRLLFNQGSIDQIVRNGIKQSSPVDRAELDSFIESVENNTVQIVLENYRRELDRIGDRDLDRIRIMESLAFKLAEDVTAATEAKKKAGEPRTDTEQLTVRYLGRALQLFASLLKTEQTA